MNNLAKKIESFSSNTLWTKVFLFLFTIFIFNIKFRYLPSGDTYPNELLPITIINEGNLDFNEFVENSDKLPYYFRKVNNKVISSYPVVPGILNTPVYFVANLAGVDMEENKFLLSMLTSSLLASLSVVFMYFCLLIISNKKTTAFYFALIYAFGTSVLSIASRGIW